MTDDWQATYCDQCDYPVVLVQVQGGGYGLRCGCREYGIDVTECVSDSSLTQPIAGHWSTINDEPDQS